MLQKLPFILQQDCRIDPAKPLIVGVSGGPDSLCLLDVLDSLGYLVIVAHFNHHLRPEANAEAEMVQHEAENRGLPFIVGEADVALFAEAQALSVEEAARTLRYRFLFAKAQHVGAQAVAVAHTADDQVETVLMHLLRGAGISGLRGMAYRVMPTPWSMNLPLVRPLLEVWREDVLAYCQMRSLQPVYDLTNLDTTYFRNRLRQELIPILEGYNPRFRQVLWRTAQILSGDYAVLEQAVDEAWAGCGVTTGEGYLFLDAPALRLQPPGLLRHLIRRAIGVLRPGLRDIGFEIVEQALDFLMHPPPAGRAQSRNLAAGLRLFLENERLGLAAWEADLPSAKWPQLTSDEEHLLNIPGEIVLSNGWVLAAQIAEMPGDLLHFSDDPYTAWGCLDNLKCPLQIRPRRRGDRFLPLGMEGHSLKLSDYFVNEKLPQRARALWPLVCSGGDILWIPGYRLSHLFRLTSRSKQAALLRLYQQL